MWKCAVNNLLFPFYEDAEFVEEVITTCDSTYHMVYNCFRPILARSFHLNLTLVYLLANIAISLILFIVLFCNLGF